jgi:hypothetical protein
MPPTLEVSTLAAIMILFYDVFSKSWGDLAKTLKVFKIFRVSSPRITEKIASSLQKVRSF